MKGKLIPSIAGLTLALGLSVANAGPASGVESLANGATNARPAPAAQGSAGMEAFSAVLGSAHYVPMSDRELSGVKGTGPVGSALAGVAAGLPAPLNAAAPVLAGLPI